MYIWGWGGACPRARAFMRAVHAPERVPASRGRGADARECEDMQGSPREDDPAPERVEAGVVGFVLWTVVCYLIYRRLSGRARARAPPPSPRPGTRTPRGCR